MLEGNTAERRHAKFIPGGLTFQQTREPMLTDTFDEWLARVVCYAFWCRRCRSSSSRTAPPPSPPKRRHSPRAWRQ